MKSGVLGKYYTSDSPQNDKGKAPSTGKGGERRKKNTRNGMTKTISMEEDLIEPNQNISHFDFV